ncbi:MAG: hypothetical protein H8D96_02125 [Desulfobacterales bacterium]|uniref:Uncharacterized protein n=1 Tax=Candidatus Desulfatibia vada TaxID=2841696 RepID=A0A8J6P0S2_9BACT|nr:hypothetical protein [Candidatus Desulfatibia vada]
MKNQNSMTINILVKKELDIWVGHCLELDIVATNPNRAKLQKDIIDLVVAQVDYAFSNNNLDCLYHPAPKEVWEEFYSCKEAIEKKIAFKSQSQKNRTLKTFVPPWIIAKTCLSESACVV